MAHHILLDFYFWVASKKLNYNCYGNEIIKLFIKNGRCCWGRRSLLIIFDSVSDCYDFTNFVVKNTIVSSVQYLRFSADHNRLHSRSRMIGKALVVLYSCWSELPSLLWKLTPASFRGKHSCRQCFLHFAFKFLISRRRFWKQQL